MSVAGNPQSKKQADLRKLYSSASEIFDVGDFDQFRVKLGVPESRQKFFNALGQHYDIGNYNDFSKKIDTALIGEQDFDNTLLGSAKRTASGLVESIIGEIPSGYQRLRSAAGRIPSALLNLMGEEDAAKSLQEETTRQMKGSESAAKELRTGTKKLTEKYIGAKPGSPIDFDAYMKASPAERAHLTARLAIETLPLMAVLAGASASNPPAGAAMLFGIEAGETESAFDEMDARGEKIDPVYRDLAVVGKGALNAALDRVGLKEAIKPAVYPKARSVLWRLLTSVGREVPTESLQEVNAILAETGARLSTQDIKDMKTFFDAALIDLSKNSSRIQQSALGATIGATGVNYLSEGARVLSERNRSVKQQEVLENVAKNIGAPSFESLPQGTKEAIIEKVQESQKQSEESKIDEAVSKTVSPDEKNVVAELDEISQSLYKKPYAEIPHAQRKILQQRYNTLAEKAQAKKIDDAIAKKVGLKKQKVEKPARKESQPPAVETSPSEATAAAPVAQKEPVTEPAQKKPEVVTTKEESSPSQSAVAPSPVSARAGEEPQPSKTAVVERPTHKEFDRAFETFQEVAAKQTGKPVPEQSAAIAEELRARKVNPVIIDELTNPRRALKPRNPEAERSATSRPERIARAANPTPTLKPKVDAVAQANVDFRNKEAALLKAREEIKDEIEARGGEVVVDTDTGAMTITLKPGRAKISESDQALIERLRAEAADAGAYSLATVGQGFEVSATPERIADAKSLPAGDFKARALEFLRRNAEAKAAEKVFKQEKEDARNDLVDYYLAERAAGKETPSALLGLAKDGTKVEVMARRVRSAAEPDLAVGGRDFPKEIAEAKKQAKERDTETGEPYIETRKAGDKKVAQAKERGAFVAESQRKYGREDIDYNSWYSEWSKSLARTTSRKDLEKQLKKVGGAIPRAANASLRAIEKTTSMKSNSQTRAQTGNVIAGLGDKAIALRSALEIYDLFPEKTLDERLKRQAEEKAFNEASHKAADEWLDRVWKGIKALEDKHAKLLAGAGLYDTFRKGVSDGKLSKQRFKELQQEGRLISDENYAQALEVRKEIEAIRNTELVVPEKPASLKEQSEGYQPNRPGDFLFNPEAVFEQKPYEPNYKKRPDATPRTDRLAKEFVDDLGKNRKRGRVYLANAIDASARETGQISLVGQEMITADDVAVVGQVARDPRVEHLRYVLVKDGESIGSYVVGSRLPSATAAFPYASTKEGIAWLNGLMEETGADGYFMLHNHPSGEVDTSGKEDLDVTETVSKGVKGFKGHVIVDSNVYATITREKDGSLKKQIKQKFFGEDKLLVPSLDHPLIGRKAEDANDLMAIGKSVQTPEGWATLVGAKPDSRIRGIAEVEEALLQTKGKRRAAVIRKFARDTGSANVFLVADQKFFDANKDTLMKAVELGFITDAVSNEGDSIISQFPKLRKENVFFGKEIEAGRVVKEGGKEEPAIVRESQSTYGKAGLNRDQFLDLGRMVNDFLKNKDQVAKLSKAEREEFAEILEVLKDYKELSEKADLSPSEKVLLKYAIRDIESPEGKRVIEKVQAALRDNKPIEASWLDKIAEWTASMYLWRLASVGSSIGSNLFRQLLKYPELKLAAWFNQGVARQTRVERTRFSEEAEKDFRDAWTGEEFKKAARKALDIMQEKPDAAEESKFFEREKVKRKSIGGKKGKFIRAGLNAQAAIDVLFRQPATTAAIARYSFREAAKTSNNRVEQAKKANAIAQNVRRLKALKDAKQEVPEYLEKFEPILAKAESDAEAQTFQSELDGFMKHVSEIRRYPLARIFVPFFNTRMNILLQAYARTPLSAFGSEFRDLGAKYLKKSLTAEEAGKLSDRMAEITLGTAAFLVTTAALYGLSDDDEELITGDFDEKTIGEKPAGWLPNAVRVGDTYVSLKGFEPYATIFTAFGNAASGKKSLPRNAAEALAKAAFSNPMTDELFDIMGSLKDGDADKFFVDMVAGAATPGLLQDISKIVDPTIRQKEGLEDRFKSRVGIPGVSATLPEKIDVFGEDLEPQTSGEKALKALTGVSISKSKEDPARREIRKLGLKHKLDAITHKGVSLEPWEVLALNKSIGDEYHKTVLKLLQNPTYLVADKEARKTKLRSVRKGLIDKQKAIIEKTPYFMARERVAGAQKEALERVKEQLAE